MAWLTQIFLLYILVIKIQGRIIYDNCDDECTRNRYHLRRTYKKHYEPRFLDEDCTSGCQESDADISVVDDCDDICGENDKRFFRNCPHCISNDNDETSKAKSNRPAISPNKDIDKPKSQSDTTDQNAKPDSNNVAPKNDYILVEVPNNEGYYNPAPLYTTNYVPAVSYAAQYYTVPLSSSLIPVNTGQVYSYIPSVSQNVGNPIVVAPTPGIVSPSVSNAQIYVPSNCRNNGDQLILVPENDVNSKSCNNDGKVYVLKEDTSKENQPAQNNQ